MINRLTDWQYHCCHIKSSISCSTGSTLSSCSHLIRSTVLRGTAWTVSVMSVVSGVITMVKINHRAGLTAVDVVYLKLLTAGILTAVYPLAISTLNLVYEVSNTLHTKPSKALATVRRLKIVY